MDFGRFINDANVKAMLDVIGKCEGADYDSLFGDRPGHPNKFTDFSQHPLNDYEYKDKSGKVLHTTAAGKYQITLSTWKWLVSLYHFTDFTASTQDKAAIALISSHNALMDTVNGRFETALYKCRNEWASLPTATVAQPHRDLITVKQWYEQGGGKITV